MDKIKTVIIGFGYRGQYLFELIGRIGDFDIVAVADPLPVEISPGVKFYGDGTDDYLNMLDDCCPDLAVVASPWDCHIRHAESCLKKGCNVAMEIKGGLGDGEYDTLSQLVETCGKKIYPMENVMFMRDILAVKNMVSKGLFGRIMHLRGGYRHDIRKMIIDAEGVLGGMRTGEGSWRSSYYTSVNGDIYPTHGFAPLYMIAGINRTDSLTALASFSSGAAGIDSYIRGCGNNNVPRITMGDIVSTVMTTKNGVLITLTHDTTLPRPKGFDFEVQGTRGIWDWERHRIYIDGLSEKWEDDEEYIGRYEDRYWKEYGAEAIAMDTHHSGMDYIMLKAITDDINGIYPYPANIEDLELWTSISVLSIKSIAEGRTVLLK